MNTDPSEIVRKGYDQAAQQYRDERTEELLQIDLFQRFSKKVSSVLELGCGSGFPVAQYLLDQKKRYVGVDISQQQIKMAQEAYPNGKFVVSDMVAYLERVPDQTYDGVIALFSIFHVPRTLHTHILQRISCVLKPGGYFLMNTGNHAQEGIENDWLGADAMYWSLMSPKWYKVTLADLGYENIEHKLDTKKFQGEDETTHYYLAQRPSK